MKILIADDRMENRYLLESLLGAEGFSTVSVSDGIGALAALKNEHFDAIISDLLMPKMDGFQLIRECKKDPALSKIPFIIYTATYTDAKDIRFGLSLGAARYIIKPAETDELLRQLNETLGLVAAGVPSGLPQETGDTPDTEREYSRRLVAKLDKKILELEKSEEKFRNVFDWANDAILLHTLTTDTSPGRFIDANEVACRMLGYSRDELLAMGPFGIVPPAEYPVLRSIIERLTGTDSVLFETQLLRKDGSVVPAESNAHLVTFQGERIWVSHIRDITGRKQVEKALRESEEKYRILADISPEMVFLIDPGGIVQYVNRAAAGQFRAAPSDLAGRHLSDLFPPQLAQRHLDAVREVVADRKILCSEFTEQFPSGPVHIEARLIPVTDGQDHVIGVLGLSNDISQRKQAEEQRENLIRDLARKNEELDRFTYTVSHDLKSPLISIRAYAGILEEDVVKDPGKAPEHIARIAEAAERMENMITSLLLLSRSGRSVEVPVRVPVADLAREAAQILAIPISSRGVALQIPDNLPIISGDRQRLLQVMTNLIENAVRFMGSQEHPRIEIGVADSCGGAEIYVRDNGMGIEPENLNKIFGLFTRLNPSIPGTGIGLATVKRIIEAHGGRIRAESGGPDKGATFFFTLPLLSPAETDTNNNP
jgi:PAS domain S-box-containing protein